MKPAQKARSMPLTGRVFCRKVRGVIGPLRNYVVRNPSFWMLNLGAWTAFGVLAALAQFYYSPTLPIALLLALIQTILAYGISSLMRLAYRRPYWGQPFRVATAALVVALSLGGAFLQATLVQAFVYDHGWGNPRLTPEMAWLIRIKITWLAYISWGLGYFWLKAEAEAHFQRNSARKAQDEARNMELQMLRSQLDPHFLFNSLNGISAEVGPHPDTAVEMIDELSDYLRYSLDHRKEVLAPLSAELDTMDAYLRMEKARFGDRLLASVTSDEPTRHRQVPSFLLQPFVENAVKHGLQDASRPLEIAVRATSSDGRLNIEVTNTGSLRAPFPEGVGLSTLRRRLELHYPHRHRFSLIEDGPRVRAQLILEGEPCSGF